MTGPPEFEWWGRAGLTGTEIAEIVAERDAARAEAAEWRNTAYAAKEHYEQSDARLAVVRPLVEFLWNEMEQQDGGAYSTMSWEDANKLDELTEKAADALMLDAQVSE